MTAVNDGTAMGISILGFPFLIAYLIAGRRSTRSWNRFAAVFAVLWIIQVFAAISAVHQKDGAAVMAVAKEFAEKLKQQNRQVQATTADFSALSDLYSVASLGDERRIRDVLAQSQQFVELNRRNRESGLRTWDEWRSRLINLELTRHNRLRALSELDAAIGPARALTNGLQTAEDAWISETQALYQLALANKSRVRREGDRLVTTDPALINEFNDRVHRCGNLRKTYLSKREELLGFAQRMQSRVTTE